MKEQKVLIKGLSKFVDERNIKKVRLIFDEFHPSDIYEEIKDWPAERAVLLLRLLKEDDAADLFAELDTEQQQSIINTLTSEEISEIFEELYTDEAIDILEDLPAKMVRKVLKSADSETRSKINGILRYDEDNLGYHMVVDYIAIPTGLTIRQAKDEIKRQINTDDLEIVGNVFVYDKEDGKYVGYVTPGDIIANENTTKISTLIEKVPPVSTNSSLAEAEEAMSKYSMSTIPVVNSTKRLVGVIEADDIIEWFEDVSDAAFGQSAVKVSDKPYLETTAMEIFMSRVGWIVALIFIGAFSQIIILGFQQIWMNQGFMADPSLASSGLTGSALAIFAVATAMSVSSSINDSAGNTGSQTSSTLVRAIALKEVGKGSYLKALRKEMSVATMLGFSVAITAFIRIIIVWAVFGEFGGYGKGPATAEWIGYMMLIAFIASVSFMITIILGNFVGAILPILADKYNIDGAIFSGPVQTTVVDILTILIYFSLTTIVFVLLNDNVGTIIQFA